MELDKENKVNFAGIGKMFQYFLYSSTTYIFIILL